MEPPPLAIYGLDQIWPYKKNELHDEVDRLSKNVLDLESKCRSNDVLARGKEESLQRKIEGLVKENGQNLAAMEKQKAEKNYGYDHN